MFPTFSTPTMEQIRAACAAMPERDPDPIVLAIVGDAEFDALKRATAPAAPMTNPQLDSLLGIPIYAIAGFNGGKQVRRSELRGLTPVEFVDVIRRAMIGGKGLVNAIVEGPKLP